MAPTTRLQAKHACKGEDDSRGDTLRPEEDERRKILYRMSRTDFLKEFKLHLDDNASIHVFQELLACNGVEEHLRFLPPYDFDNIFDMGAVYHAVAHNRPDVVTLALEKLNDHKFNVLHVAVLYDSSTLIEHLIHDIPRYGHELDKNGKTPLHLAFHKVNAKSVKRLLESGCWEKYSGNDKRLLVHKVLEAFAFDRYKSNVTEWESVTDWLNENRWIEKGARDENGRTALDLVDEWDIWDVRLKNIARDAS